jgi:membrane-associated protease RseP (regulator of RpoE activity)
MLMWRTKRGLGLLDRVANFSRRGWKAFGIAGMVVGCVFMVLIFLNLTDKAIKFIGAIEAPGAGGAMLVIPGITIPLVSGVIALATVLLVHEPAHGIVARRVGLPVKSTGLFLLAVIPGAFVEPDEKKLKKSSVSKRLQVYGAGSLANILFGFLCLGILLTLVVPLPGLYIWGVGENTPAANENLQPGMRLMEIGYGGSALVEISDYSDFDNFMEGTKPGDNIILVTDNRAFEIILKNHPTENKGYLGVYLVHSVPRSRFFSTAFTNLLIFWESPEVARWGINQYSYSYRAPDFVINLLIWMFILNVGIGLFNLLPLKPLDGGYITECLVEKASSRSTAKRVALVFSAISLVVIILNLLAWVV